MTIRILTSLGAFLGKLGKMHSLDLECKKKKNAFMHPVPILNYRTAKMKKCSGFLEILKRHTSMLIELNFCLTITEWILTGKIEGCDLSLHVGVVCVRGLTAGREGRFTNIPAVHSCAS